MAKSVQRKVPSARGTWRRSSSLNSNHVCAAAQSHSAICLQVDGKCALHCLQAIGLALQLASGDRDTGSALRALLQPFWGWFPRPFTGDLSAPRAEPQEEGGAALTTFNRHVKNYGSNCHSNWFHGAV